MRSLPQLVMVVLWLLFASSAGADESIQVSDWKLPVQHRTASDKLVELGRKLFFDPRLFAQDGRSCASCHHPGFAWSYPESFLSNGKATQRLSRQVPSLLNTRFYRHYFWDSRVDDSLDAAIAQHLEALIPANQFRSGGFEWTYRDMFSQALGEENTSRNAVARALAAFVLSLRSDNSPFDRWLAGDRQAISRDAVQGFRLFRGKAGCIRCHSPPAFTDSGIHNIGLDSMDPGYSEITGNPAHHNAFRTPSLRQVARTPPYMHNGVYRTLEEVIAYYNQGGSLRGGGNEIRPLNLSKPEQQQLIAFLQTLSSEGNEVAIPLLPLSVH